MPKGRFSRNVALLAGGTVVGQSLVIIATPLLTRLYSPEDFGVLAAFASILAITMNFASLRYDFALPLAEEKNMATNLLLLCIILVVINSMIISFLIFFSKDLLNISKKFNLIVPYVWLLPIGFLFAGFYEVFNCWAIRLGAYNTIARTKVSQGAGNVIAQLILGIINLGPLGLLSGYIIGQAAGLSSLVLRAWQQSNKDLREVSAKGIKWVAVRYKNFPLYQSNASFINSVGLQIPPLLFTVFYGPEIAGLFYLTQKVFSLPVTLVGRSVNQVFVGEAAKLVRSNPAGIKKLYRTLNFKIFIIALPVCTCLAIGGPWLFNIVFGTVWKESGYYAQVLSIVLLLKLTTESAINLAIIERQGLSFLWAVLRVVLVIGGITAAYYARLSAFCAVSLYSLAMVIAYLTKYIMWETAINKLINRRTEKIFMKQEVKER